MLNRDTHAAVAYWIGMLFVAGLLIDRWFDDDIGPDHPAYALLVTTWTFFLTPGVAIPLFCLRDSASPLVPRPRGRARTPPHARRRHLRLAARALRMESPHRRPLRGFDGTRAGLPSLERSARGGIIAHGACFAIHVLLAAAALFTGHPWGALWILLPGVVLHLYPVLLQRSIMLRLQPLLDKSGLDQLSLKPYAGYSP